MSTILIIFVVVVLILLHEHIWLFIYKLKARRYNCGLPSIRLSRPLGIKHVHQSWKAKKEHILVEGLHQAISSSGRETFLDQSLFHYQIISSDPENYKSVYSSNFKDFSLGLRRKQLGMFGGGIFVKDGMDWKHSRSTLRPQFSREQIRRLDSVCYHAQTLVEQITKSTGYVGMQALFHRMAMDTATEFLFGESVGSLVGDEFTVHSSDHSLSVTSSQFVESYKRIIAYGTKRVLAQKFYWLVPRGDIAIHRQRAQAFMDHYVDKAIAEAGSRKDDEDEYVLSTALVKASTNRAFIRSEMFDVLVAGIDTTAGTLTFCIYWLARYPHIWERLRQEICSTFESKDSITYEKLRACKYLAAFINETLRVSPLVPFNARTATRDTTLPRGGGPDQTKPVFVPKGTLVMFSIYSIHRDVRSWGKNSDKFDPERWLSGEAPKPWTYLPFSGGPRICLGQQFALTEVSATLVHLALTFSKIETNPQFNPEPTYDFRLAMHLARPEDSLVKFTLAK